MFHISPRLVPVLAFALWVALCPLSTASADDVEVALETGAGFRWELASALGPMGDTRASASLAALITWHRAQALGGLVRLTGLGTLGASPESSGRLLGELAWALSFRGPRRPHHAPSLVSPTLGFAIGCVSPCRRQPGGARTLVIGPVFGLDAGITFGRFRVGGGFVYRLLFVSREPSFGIEHNFEAHLRLGVLLGH